MKKIFFITWVFALLFTVFVLAGISRKDIGRKLLYMEYPEGYSTGGLFRMSKIEQFKGKMRAVKDSEKGTLQNADVITFGDSFFDFKLESPVFAKHLEDRTGLTIFNRDNNDVDYTDERDLNPLTYLKAVHYVRGKKKVMILEVVERYALENARRYNPAPPVKKMILERVYDGIAWRLRAVDDWFKAYVVVLNNDNSDIVYFFSHNVVSYPLTKWIANARFNVWGEVDRGVGAYSLNPKMLFHSEDLEFYGKITEDAELETMAGHVQHLAKELMADYNIELVYMIMPNKYSIYNDLVNGLYKYDNFIPRVNAKLREKGIPVIDVYTAYMDFRKKNGDTRLLYFPSDTHFTPLGKDIAVNLTARELIRLLLPGGSARKPA